MSSEQQSCLRFSVEESVWFQKGQEVSELISISLEPDIQIYEQDQYVSIRGALFLSGEYQVDVEGEEDEEYRPFTQARVVQEVEVREDGVYALNHRFPVDITIPKNRIQSLDDIYVSIESFDYNVPVRGCLELEAELSISGIYGQQQSTPAWDEQQATAEVEAKSDEEAEEFEPVYRNSQADIEYEEDSYPYYEEKVEEVEEVEETEEEKEDILDQHNIETKVEYDYNEEGEYEPFQVEARKSAVSEEEESKTNAVHQEEEKEEYSFTPNYAFQINKQEDTSEEPSNLVSFFEKRTPNQEAAEVEVMDYEPENTKAKEVDEDQDDENSRDENDLSLTKIFETEDGEEFTRLKICIVQQGEAIDHIAERYDVTIQQLIRINRLSTEDNVHEGQLLYIPVKAASKS